MSTRITQPLLLRSKGNCELCTAAPAAIAFAVSPKTNDAIENEVAICTTCAAAMESTDHAEHWQCLAGSIWNAEPSVQALSYRLLQQYAAQDWAADILSAVELPEDVVEWAMSAYDKKALHLDANGVELLYGDTVVLTQVLNVKGANFMAPKGTIVRKIKLVADNAEQIEGKINGQTIVILTKYVRKNG